MKSINKFSKYLRENHLDAYVRELIITLKRLKAPIMDVVSHLPEEQFVEMVRLSSYDFLIAMENGTVLERTEQRLQAWEEDKLPGIPKNKILPSDFILVYYAQKMTLIKNIRLYTDDYETTLEIIEDLEEYFVRIKDMSIKKLFRVKEEYDRQRILNEELETKIKERTRLLQESNKELEAFSYSVSHDLRSPLRSINGYAKIILEDFGEELNDEVRKNLTIIINNASMMGKLIDDLLTFSRLGKRAMQESRIDMDRLVRATIDELREADDEKVNIAVHPLPDAAGDELLLKQVISNLLENAIKYSSKKEKINVEVGGSESNGDVIYYVKDNGAGFDMKYYNKLFGVFQRLHRRDEFEGTGVGLAIVYRIISRHQGKVWAESTLGEGSTFYFSLKAEKNYNQTLQPEVSGDRHSK